MMVYTSHGSWSIFFCDKKKQRNCTRESFLGVLLILKTLTYKSGIKGLKSYPTFFIFFAFFGIFRSHFHSAGLFLDQLSPPRTYLTWHHVLYVILGHPGAIWAPTGTLKWPKTAPKWPKMAQNHPNDSKWHCVTPNGPKTLQMGILHDYMSCWSTLGPFQRPIGAP